MPDPLFITQRKLEEWIEDGEVLFEDNKLTIFAENVSYALEPAVRIIKILDGVDTSGLLGKLQRASDLAALGAEQLSGSLIVGDTAYECEEGFVALPPQAPPLSAAPGSVASPSEEKANDMDMLTDFLLKHM